MTALAPGFADPVIDAQRTFRAVLDAMARPGRIVTVAAPAESPPALGRAAAAFALTLLDYETPVWLDAGAAAATEWLRFHCGAPLVARPGDARFALVADPAAAPSLEHFSPGSAEYPEASCTVLLQVAALGRGPSLVLSGPGIRERETLAVDGLPAGFVAAWQANGALYPCGVDVVLAAGDRLAALPRTVRIGG